MDEASAVAYNYAHVRSMDIVEKTDVAFFDFGESKCGVFIARFTKGNVKIIAQEYLEFGLRNLDVLLIEKIIAMFKASNGKIVRY